MLLYNLVTEYKKSEWITIIIFDVIFPTWDVFSDLSLIINWLWNSHTTYAIFVSIPLLCKFLFICYKWYMIEKRKKWTWILLLAQIWPQWRSARVARLLYKGDTRAQLKKQTLVSEIRSIEPFLESVPTVLIKTMIIVQATFGILNIVSDGDDHVDCTEHEHWEQWKTNYCAVFDGLGGIRWFLITYATSVASGTLGLTQFLQTGPTAILSQNGHLRGMLTWKFIIASLSTMLALVTKVIFAGIMMEIASELCSYRAAGGGCFHGVIMSSTLIFFSLIILPHIILSVSSIAISTGCSKKLFKIIFDHPAICLLPVFTYFVVGPRQICCDSQHPNYIKQKELITSKKLTIFNILLTAILYGVVIGILWHLDHDDINGFTWFYTIFTPTLCVSILINAVFLSLDKPLCFSKSQRCWCSPCCGPKCYELQDQYINTASDDIKICVKHQND